MAQIETKKQLLKKLVDELLKDSVDSKEIHRLTKKLEIPYSADRAEQMSLVLLDKKLWQQEGAEA